MKTLLPDFQHISDCKTRHLLRKTAILSCLVLSLGISSAYADVTPSINQLVQAGQYEAALKKTNSELSKYPNDAQLRFLKGIILTEQNKSAEAIAVFTKLTEDFPDLPEPYNNLAVLYAARGEYDKARHTLDLAIRTNPIYATALKNLSNVYAKMASQAYDKALQIEPDAKAPQAKLAMVQSLRGNLTGGTNPQVATNVRTNPQKFERLPEPAAVAPVIPAPAKVAEATLPSITPPPVVKEKPAAVVVPEPSAPIKPKEVKPVETKPVAPIVEAKPTPQADAKADKTEQNSQSQAILTIINNWAKAWGDQNVRAYLGYYADNFKPANGASRKDWANERRARIEDKGHIAVEVIKPVVRIEGNTATVKFRQGYTSNRLTVTSRKTMILEKTGNKWLIVQEIAGK
jgi:tetratricopeptide (TPR) repeat protein